MKHEVQGVVGLRFTGDTSTYCFTEWNMMMRARKLSDEAQ
jgi:hypothetical protein